MVRVGGSQGSVSEQIRRDPPVADFILLLASALPLDFPRFADLPAGLAEIRGNLFQKLPPIRELAACETNGDLAARIGDAGVSFLRYVFAEPKSHVFSAGANAYRLGDQQTVQFLVFGNEFTMHKDTSWAIGKAPMEDWWEGLVDEEWGRTITGYGRRRVVLSLALSGTSRVQLYPDDICPLEAPPVRIRQITARGPFRETGDSLGELNLVPPRRFSPPGDSAGSIAQRVNRRLDLHKSAAGLTAIVRCSQVPRWGQTK
jgi:hypothetical protein